MRIQAFDWFVDREKNKPCLVAGTAPTIVDFPYERFDGVYITCGDGPTRLKDLFQANYWVVADNHFFLPKLQVDIVNSFPETVFIFADTVAYWPPNHLMDLNSLNEELKVNWFAYAQRHLQYNDLACGDPDRDTLQEFFQKHYQRKNHYSPGSTCAIHTLAFAMILGCNPIYLQGIEIPIYKDDHIHKGEREKNNKRDVKSVFYFHLPQILRDFQYLVDTACDNGIEVYILSKTSTLNTISNLKYKEPAEIGIKDSCGPIFYL